MRARMSVSTCWIRTAIAALLCVCSSADAGERARFLFELNGIPVGTVEMALDGQDYRYTSTHFFARGRVATRQRVRSAAFKLLKGTSRDAESGEVLESLWLWKRPQRGCHLIRSELEGRRSRGCVHHAYRRRAIGTLGTEEFIAEYQGDRLRTLSLGASRFTRADVRASSPRPPPLFAEGWPVTGRRGALRLEGFAVAQPAPTRDPGDGGLSWSSASDARWSAELIYRGMKDDPSATCVDFVRAFTRLVAERRRRDVLVVHGLVTERDADRAFPHVWARVRVDDTWLDLDPSRGEPVTPETHLELTAVSPDDTSGHAGRIWLSLASSSAHVVRRP